MNTIPIYLVVGFLGSGKTTLLKRLVNAAGCRNFLYVINEFCAVDVDVAQIEKEGGNAIAVAGGSIFCRYLRSEFISVMEKISEGVFFRGEIVCPDAIVIEASGMADPRFMGKLLSESDLDRRYHVAGITAVVDPGMLTKLLLVLPNIKGQIQCADLILFNKIDLHAPEVIDNIVDRVRSINNRAKLLHCTHCDVDPAIILDRGEPVAIKLENADYNKYQDAHFERELLTFGNKPALNALLELFSEDLEGLYRVKGYVECIEGWYFVEWREGGLACNATQKQQKSTIMLIWTPENEPSVIAKLRYLAF